MVAISTVALALLLIRDQNCLRKSAFSKGHRYRVIAFVAVPLGTWEGGLGQRMGSWEAGKLEPVFSGSDWLWEPVVANSSSLGDPGKAGLISQGLAPWNFMFLKN